MIAKYRKAEYPGEWWLTDFTMEQVEKRLNQVEQTIKILSDKNTVLQAENAVLRERLTRCTQDNFELCQDSAILQAAAENLIFKYRQDIPLEAVDFEWLERAVGGQND